MKNNIKKMLKLNKLLIFCFGVIVFFTSCSQNLPEINYTDYSVIYSYNDDSSFPSAKLSVFVYNTSDVRRCDRISLLSKSSNYLWETNNVKKIASGDTQWAGNVNFVVPEGEKIPQGTYEITYVNADEEEAKNSFGIYYDDSFYDLKAKDVQNKMNYKGNLNIAIYDENRVLIYFGEKNEDLSTKGDIFNTFQNAVYYNDVWITYDKTVICILPENKL